MAKWITHTMIADKILEKGIKFDRKGFCVGNIAPDCNVENEDWTDFTPPKKVTHFMNGIKKTSVDYERFYNEYIKDRSIGSKEEYAFLWGYYSHLVADLMFQKFIRNESRISEMFKRIETNDLLSKRIVGMPKNFDTIKAVFGKKETFNDIEYIEHSYLSRYSNASYLEVLSKIDYFADYLDFMPENCIVRKLGVMLENVQEFEERELYFFSLDEYTKFIYDTSEYIYQLILNRID